MITEQGFMLHVVVAIRIMGFIAADPLVNEFTILIAHLIIAYDLLMNTIQTIDLQFEECSIYLWGPSALSSIGYQLQEKAKFYLSLFKVFHQGQFHLYSFLKSLISLKEKDYYWVFE